MSYTYTTFVTALSVEMVVPTFDTDFISALPQIIDDAEQRCYRELDLLGTIVRDTTGVTVANSRNFALPSSLGRFVVVEGVNAIPSTTNRIPLVAISREAMDMFWPSELATSAAAYPTNFAMVTDQTLLLGPAPGSIMPMEIIGTIRPNALSADNPTSFLSLYLSDLFFAAAMVAAAGYMKNYGAQADEPKMAMSWEQMFQTRLQSASREEARKKYGSSSWTSKAPVQAQPERG
jgi:hypothetical protein